jgi:hypothetical protein
VCTRVGLYIVSFPGSTCHHGLLDRSNGMVSKTEPAGRARKNEAGWVTSIHQAKGRKGVLA